MDTSPEGCITVRVERGNPIEGALPSHTLKKSNPEEFRRLQKRSTKQQIPPTQFNALNGVEGLAAIYQFRNTGIVGT